MKSQQFQKIIKWQQETFPYATALSKIEHLKEEINELTIEVEFNSPGKTLEFADCILLLYGAASECGMCYEDICLAIDEKMSINRQRNWGTPDVNGVSKHI